MQETNSNVPIENSKKALDLSGIIVRILIVTFGAILGVILTDKYILKPSPEILVFYEQAQTSVAIDEKGIQEALRSIDPDITIKTIRPTSFYGLYEAQIDNGFVLYVNHDGSSIINGTLIEREGDSYVNRTEEVFKEYRTSILANIDEQDFISYPAEDEVASVIVFTDPSCPYCQKFHADIQQLNDGGITVRYLPFGRSGPGSAMFETIDQIWCSKDRQSALSAAKRGEDISPTDSACASIADKYYEMGAMLRVEGTPYIFLEDGELIRGYLPAEHLIEALAN